MKICNLQNVNLYFVKRESPWKNAPAIRLNLSVDHTCVLLMQTREGEKCKISLMYFAKSSLSLGMNQCIG